MKAKREITSIERSREGNRARAPRKEIAFLDACQVRVLLAAARGDRLEALCVVAVSTGMRKGELLGLRWGDLDLGAATLMVMRQLRARPDGGLALAELKTARSRRLIQLPATAVDALVAPHLAEQRGPRIGGGRVFCSTADREHVVAP